MYIKMAKLKSENQKKEDINEDINEDIKVW
jgi:hypothetical protein